jgi:hypothetical protein
VAGLSAKLHGRLHAPEQQQWLAVLERGSVPMTRLRRHFMQNTFVTCDASLVSVNPLLFVREQTGERVGITR